MLYIPLNSHVRHPFDRFSNSVKELYSVYATTNIFFRFKLLFRALCKYFHTSIFSLNMYLLDGLTFSFLRNFYTRGNVSLALQPIIQEKYVRFKSCTCRMKVRTQQDQVELSMSIFQEVIEFQRAVGKFRKGEYVKWSHTMLMVSAEGNEQSNCSAPSCSLHTCAYISLKRIVLNS